MYNPTMRFLQSSRHILIYSFTQFCECVLKTRKHISPTPYKFHWDPRQFAGQPRKSWWPQSVPALLTTAKGQRAAEPLNFPMHSQRRSHSWSSKWQVTISATKTGKAGHEANKCCWSQWFTHHSCLGKASCSLRIFTAVVHAVLKVFTGCLEGSQI